MVFFSFFFFLLYSTIHIQILDSGLHPTKSNAKFWLENRTLWKTNNGVCYGKHVVVLRTDCIHGAWIDSVCECVHKIHATNEEKKKLHTCSWKTYHTLLCYGDFGDWFVIMWMCVCESVRVCLYLCSYVFGTKCSKHVIRFMNTLQQLFATNDIHISRICMHIS